MAVKVRQITPIPVIAAEPLQPIVKKKKLKAIGYGIESDYMNYPTPRKRLLAIRAAKLDAYRNLAETLYGTRITGVSTVRDAAIESDRFRAYIDGVVRGAQLLSLEPKGEGIYEAELELDLTSNIYSCFTTFTSACMRQTGNVQTSLTTGIYVDDNCDQCANSGCNPCTATIPITDGCLDGCSTVATPEVIYYR